MPSVTDTFDRQFYRLSQLHHPDHNPQDSTAPSRFHALSTAYTTLRNPETRAHYDRIYFPIKAPRGSYSSASSSRRAAAAAAASTVNGARPATGLSARRTPFQGPPTSFYRSGGWGQHTTKRRTAQFESARSADDIASTGRADGGGRGSHSGGRGAGVQYPFLDASVPHFDHVSHFRTQEQQEERWRQRGRRTTRAGGEGTIVGESEERSDGREQGMGAAGFAFIILLTVVLGGGMLPWKWKRTSERRDGHESRDSVAGV